MTKKPFWQNISDRNRQAKNYIPNSTGTLYLGNFLPVPLSLEQAKALPNRCFETEDYLCRCLTAGYLVNIDDIIYITFKGRDFLAQKELTRG